MRLAVFWYTLTHWFTGLRARSTRVPRVETLDELPRRLKHGSSYKADPRWNDVLYHPRLVQRRIDTGALLGDCEDHAAYWAVVLLKSRLAKRAWLGVVRFRDAGRRAGHVVCVFEDNHGELYWADYGAPNPIPAGAPWSHFGELVARRYESPELLKTYRYGVELTETDGIRFVRTDLKRSWDRKELRYPAD